VGGREAREERGLLRRLGQFGIGHFLHVAAQQHGVGGEAHVLAHLAADELVVAGEDFYRHAVLVKGLDGASAVFLGGSRNATYPLSTRSRSSSFEQICFPGSSLVATARTRKPSLLRLVVLFLQPDDQSGVHRRQLPVQLEVRALVEDLFRSALGEEDCFAFGILHQYRHHAPREVERDLVQLLVLLDQRLSWKSGYPGSPGRAGS
jgi:hypothetical protein